MVTLAFLYLFNNNACTNPINILYELYLINTANILHGREIHLLDAPITNPLERKEDLLE